MDTLIRELRHAARRLRRTPGFTLVVILTLALGIGANAAIFSVVNGVLLRPLPYPASPQLVTIYHDYPSMKLEAPVSAPGFHDYRDRTHSFTSVAVETGWSATITGIGDPQRLRGTSVSARFFPTLDVAPAMGRGFLPEEDAPGRNHVVVLSDGLWHRLLGGDPHVVGRTLTFNGEPYEVVGVMPPSFRDPWQADAELWTPIALKPELFVPDNYTNEFLNLTARLAPGATLESAQREMRAFAEQLKKDHPDNFSRDWTLEVKSMMEVQTGSVRTALLVLLGAVGFVLLIACANVANLLLARAAARQKEVAIRSALGASPWDLVRQTLSESALLSTIGGGLGLLIAYWSVKSLVAIDPSRIPRVADLTIDARVVAFTAFVAIATGVLFGLAPVLPSRRADLRAALNAETRGGTADRAGLRLRRALVVAEVALALTLLTGSGLLVKSFARLQHVDPGFDPDNLITFNLALPAARYPNDTVRRQFFDAAVDRMARVPGVRAVGLTTVIPFGGSWSTGSFNVEGYTPPPHQNMPWGDIRIVSPGFFHALGIPMLAGRTFDAHDDAGAPRVAVVDEQFARRYYGGRDAALGKRLWFGDPTPTDSTRYITIVGVVGHAMHEGLDADPRIQLYLSYEQAPRVDNMDVAVRTARDPASSAPALRGAIHEVDPTEAMARIRTMDEMVSASMGQRRFSMTLLTLFGALALGLASLGLYGLMAYAVAQRTREIGVRIALGAARRDVLALVLRQGMLLVAIGAGIGLVAALALTRLLSSQLYGVRASDPVTFIAVVALLGAVALLANFLPAMRATRVDPIIALREE